MATRGLGTLTIDFIAKTGGFEQGLDQAGRRMKSFGRGIETEAQRIDKSIRNVTLAVGAMASAVVVGARSIYTSTASSIDSLNNMAQQIGTTTETLSAMRYAAQQTIDITDGNFDLAMRRMVRRLTEVANTGGGPAAKSLQILGLEAAELAKMPLDQKLLTISDAMSKVGTQGDKLLASFGLFDTQGVALTAVLDQGSAAFEEAMQKAERYGAVISSIDAQAVADAQSALADAASAFEAFNRGLTIGLAPYVKETAESISELADRFGGFGELIATGLELATKAALIAAAVIGGRLTQSFLVKANAARKAALENLAYQRTLFLMQTGITSMEAQTARLTVAQRLQVASTGALAAAQRGLAVAYGAVGGAMGVLTIAATAGYMVWSSYSKSVRESRDLVDSMQLSTEELAARMKQLNEAQAFSMLAENLKAQEAAAKQVNKAYGDLITSIRDVGMRQLRLPTVQIEKYTRMVDDARKAGEEITPVLRQIQQESGIPFEKIAEWFKYNAALVEADQKMQGVISTGDALKDTINNIGQAAATTAEDGFGALSDELTKFIDRTKQRALTSGITSELDKFIALEKAGIEGYVFNDKKDPRRLALIEDLKTIDANSRSASKGLSDAANAAKKLKEDINGLVTSLFPAIKAQQEFDKNVKLADAGLKSGALSAEQHAQALEKLNKQFIEATRTEAVKGLYERAKSIEQSNKALQDQIRFYKQSASQITLYYKEENKAALATAQATKQKLLANNASKERIDAINDEIEALTRLQAGLEGQYSAQAALETAQHWDKMAEEAKRVNEEIARDLEQNLLSAITEGGVNGFKSLIDWAKKAFASLVLRPLITPVVQGAAGIITGAMGVGSAQASNIDPMTGLSMGKTLLGGASWFTDFSGNVGNSLFDIGMSLQRFDGVLGDFGNKIIGNIDGIASGLEFAGSALNYGMGVFNIAKGKWGSGIGQIGGQLIGGPVGGAIGAMIGGALDNFFGGGETRSGGGFQRIDGTTRFVGGPSGGYGGEQTIRMMDQYFTGVQNSIDALLKGVGANARVAGLYGSFESSDKGRGGTQSGGQLVIDGNVYTFGVQGKGSGYGGTSGTAEEMLENMQKDMYFSILEAWQLAGDQLPKVLQDSLLGVDIRGSLGVDEAQALAENLLVVVNNVNALTEALTALPFQNLHDLSFDLTHTLQAAAGGVDALQSSLSVLYSEFYSESERLAIGAEQVLGRLQELGVAMPMTANGWRDLINSIEVVDDESAQLYASLLGLSGAMSQVYQAAEKTAADSLQAERNRYNQLISAAGDAMRAQQKQINDSYNKRSEAIRSSIATVNSAIRELQSIASAAQKSFASLAGISEQGSAMLRGTAKEIMQTALASARLGKSVAGIEGLSESLGVLGSITSSAYSSFADYERERQGTALELKELGELTGAQVDVQELQLNALEAQLESLASWRDAQLAAAERGYNRLVAAYESEFAKLEAAEQERAEEAMKVMLEQNALALESMDMGSDNTNRTIRALSHEASAIVSAIRSIDVRPVVNVPFAGFPQFATGGLHSGGGRIVGELGPEFDVTGPSRIHTADQLKRLFGSEETAQSKAERRTELELMRTQANFLRKIHRDARKSLSLAISKDERETREEMPYVPTRRALA